MPIKWLRELILQSPYNSTLHFDSIRFESFIQLSLAHCMNMYTILKCETLSLHSRHLVQLVAVASMRSLSLCFSQTVKGINWQTLCSHVVYSFEFILVRLNIAHCARSGYRFKVLLIVYLCVHLYIFFSFLLLSRSLSVTLRISCESLCFAKHCSVPFFRLPMVQFLLRSSSVLFDFSKLLLKSISINVFAFMSFRQTTIFHISLHLDTFNAAHWNHTRFHRFVREELFYLPICSLTKKKNHTHTE